MAGVKLTGSDTIGTILIVDDEKLTRDTLEARFQKEGFCVYTVANAFGALELLESDASVDVILTDLRMPSLDGLGFHRRVREKWPDVAVVFMTAFGTVGTAVEAMQEGAADYLTKPLNTEELVIRVRRLVQRRHEVEEIRRLRQDAVRRGALSTVVYRSPAMARVIDQAHAVADSDLTILIQGETGTGKEILARFVHEHSSRHSGPFVVVNCAALNPNLVESELFGHEAGSFTGATRRRRGRLELAGGGTLLIDELDDIAPQLQVRLLRFLHDRTFERVGGDRTLKSDVRILGATKRNLEELVRSGYFREDLYFRMNTVILTLPPLRARREDIVPLAEHFLQRLWQERGYGGEPDVSEDTFRALLRYDWPGNVRQLLHAVEHAVVFCKGRTVEPHHLPHPIVTRGQSAVVELHLEGRERISFSDVLSECERKLLQWALSRTGGNQLRAAELLGMPRTTLRSRLGALSDQEKGNHGSPTE